MGLGHTLGVRVLRIDRPNGRRVLKFDGPSGRGLRIALRAMLIKSALRDWLYGSYSLIRILVISSCAAPPYPAAPDFPPSGGQNKTPRNTLFINGSAVSTGYSATACGGKVVAPATKGGIAFPRPSGRLYGFRCPRQRHIKLPSEPARSVGRTHHSVRSTRTIEPGRREAPEPSSLKGACP